MFWFSKKLSLRSWYGTAGDASDAGGGTGDGGDGGDTNSGGGDAGAGAGGGASGKPKMFTQEEVNKFLATNRRNLQTKVTELETQLAESQASGVSSEEREKLMGRVRELSDSLKTKEELARQEASRIKTESEKKISDLQNQFNALHERYTNETIQRAIMDAAIVNEAFAPDQIVAILRPNTSLIEELDGEGNPTGNLVPKVKITGRDKEGKDKQLDLSVIEAVKVMKEIPERYGNLFKSTATGGFGFGTGVKGQGNGNVDISKMTTEEYVKARREGKIDLSKV